MIWVEDNYDRWERHDAEQESELEFLPVCSICEQKIQGEYLYEINDEIICPHCMNEHFRKDVEDFVG